MRALVSISRRVLISVVVMGAARTVLAQSTELGSPRPGYKEIRVPGGSACRTFRGVAGSRVDVAAFGAETPGRERVVARAVELVALLPPCTLVIHVVETDARRILTAANRGVIRLRSLEPQEVSTSVSTITGSASLDANEVHDAEVDGRVAYCVGKGCAPRELMVW